VPLHTKIVLLHMKIVYGQVNIALLLSSTLQFFFLNIVYFRHRSIVQWEMHTRLSQPYHQWRRRLRQRWESFTFIPMVLSLKLNFMCTIIQGQPTALASPDTWLSVAHQLSIEPTVCIFVRWNFPATYNVSEGHWHGTCEFWHILLHYYSTLLIPLISSFLSWQMSPGTESDKLLLQGP
jgi:hypothetical protein